MLGLIHRIELKNHSYLWESKLSDLLYVAAVYLCISMLFDVSNAEMHFYLDTSKYSSVIEGINRN